MECTALVLNVNYGHNKELMERCKTLKQYAQFIAEIRRNLAYGMKAQEAVEEVVDECIRNDILADILRKNRGEIVDSILTEWDEDEYRDYLKEEGIKIGEERGKIETTIEMCQEFQFSKEDTLDRIIKKFSLEYRDYLKEEGIKIGEERGKIETTIEMCQEFQFSKEDTLDRIIKKFSLKEEDAKKYMEEYWKCD